MEYATNDKNCMAFSFRFASDLLSSFDKYVEFQNCYTNSSTYMYVRANVGIAKKIISGVFSVHHLNIQNSWLLNWY